MAKKRKARLGRIVRRLAALGVTLPSAPTPLAAYVPAVQAGELLFISGMLPLQQGRLLHAGKLGSDVTVEEGIASARLAALNALAVIEQAAGSLERVTRIVRLNGYVASAPDFVQQPAVLNGASELLAAIFEQRGRHSRIAVGVAVLPLNAPVEIDLIVEINPSPSRKRSGQARKRSGRGSRR